MYPLRRCQPTLRLSPQAKQALRNFALEDLEEAISEVQSEITNLRILGLHHKAEKKQQSLRFFWELHSELNSFVDNIEEEAKQ